MAMEWKAILLCVSYYMILVVTGELVIERSPVCPDDSAAYRCSVSGGGLEWIWTTTSGQRQQVSLISGRSPVGVLQLTLERVTIILNVTEVSQSNINVIATVENPLSLNLTTMECNGQSLTISIRLMNSSLPVSLNVSSDNSSDIRIYPNVEGDINNVKYQILEENLMEVTEPIILGKPGDINFIFCQNNVSFSIGSCMFTDSTKQIQYILYPNGTWEISRSCGTIEVTCNSDGNWSVDIGCPEITTTTDLVDTVSIMTAIHSSGSTSTSTQSPSTAPLHIVIWIGVAVGSVLVVFVFALMVLVVVWLCETMKTKKLTLEVMKLHHLEKAPSYGVQNGNAATGQDRSQNRYQDRSQDRTQDRDFDTDSHQHAKTKHIPQKSKSDDMMHYEATMGHQATLHPHLITENGVQYSGIQHEVKPEDGNLNLDSLLIQLHSVTDQYQELGVAAGLSQETIEEITSHAAVAFDGLVEVCDTWIRSLKRQDFTPTWRAVSDMLQKIGQEKLARDLLQVYTTGALPVTVDMHTVEIPKKATQSPPPPVPLRIDVDIDADDRLPGNSGVNKEGQGAH